MMKRICILGLLIALVLSVAQAPAQQEGVWALSGGGVWIPKQGGGFTRVKWDPANGDIGNMDDGVRFKIGDVPGNAQNGADTAAAKGYTTWNIFGDPVVGARIKFAAGNANVNSPLSWAEITAPGTTGNAAINANPRPVQLNRTKTLRTDGWSLDYGGTRPNVIDEYDVFTTTVHEAGHVLGLGHPKPPPGTQVMDAQNSARQTEGGSWRKVEKTTPFDGQPKKLDGTALLNGARAYQNPRNDFKAGDAVGAISLYSAPIARVGANFQQGAGNGGTYSYTLINDSARNAATGLRAGYLSRDIRIPVDPSVNVSNLHVPSNWSMVRESNDVLVSYVGPKLLTQGGLAPGQTLDFSFDADRPPVIAEPNVHWAVDGLVTGDGSDDDLSGDGSVLPDFNYADFGVLDGSFTYQFNSEADRWETIPFASILTPGSVPEPSTCVLFGAGIVMLAAFVRLRHRTPRHAAFQEPATP